MRKLFTITMLAGLSLGLINEANAQCAASGNNEYIRFNLVSTGADEDEDETDITINHVDYNGAYQNYTNNSTIKWNAGSELTLEIQENGVQFKAAILWIDWEGDGTWTSSGLITKNDDQDNVIKYTLTIPEDVTEGEKLIRVRISNNSGSGNSDNPTDAPCGNGNGIVVDFKIHTNNESLPVEFINFAATHNSGWNHLNWEIAAANELSHFDIEASADGKNFSTIGQVKANDDLIADTKYSFSTKHNNGAVFYRLKQVDYTGESSYSTIVNVKTAMGQEISVYPNPNNGVLFIDGLTGAEKVQLFDMTGRLILEQNAQANHQSLNVETLNTGIYFLKVITNNGEVYDHKIMIN